MFLSKVPFQLHLNLQWGSLILLGQLRKVHEACWLICFLLHLAVVGIVWRQSVWKMAEDLSGVSDDLEVGEGEGLLLHPDLNDNRVASQGFWLKVVVLWLMGALLLLQGFVSCEFLGSHQSCIRDEDCTLRFLALLTLEIRLWEPLNWGMEGRVNRQMTDS